jgi:hypothetical protein
VPESAVHFDCEIAVGQIEIYYGSEASLWISNSVLRKDGLSEGSENFPYISFQKGHTREAPLCDGFGRLKRQFDFGFFAMPVAAFRFALEITLSKERRELSPGILRYVIGLRDDASTEARSPGLILAIRGTEHHSVLGFDLRRSASNFSLADLAQENDFLSDAFSSKFVRTIPRTSSLSPVLEPIRVGSVRFRTHRTFLFFHVPSLPETLVHGKQVGLSR